MFLGQSKRRCICSNTLRQTNSLGYLAYSILLPWITAIAAYYGDRTLLLLVYLLLSLSVFVVVIRPNVDDRTLLILTLSISLSLVLSFELASNNLIGWDIHGEYYEFLQVIRTGAWYPTEFQYSSALSISIFPAIIYLITGLDGVLIFKFIFPLLFSIVPLVLYRVYGRFMKPQFAFLAVFLFMAYPDFYIEMLELGRQEIAELFLALLLLIFITPKLSQKQQGKVMIVGLTAGLVLAHYSIAYIYLFALGLSYLLSRISKRAVPFGGLPMILTTFLIAYVWFIFVSGGAIVSHLLGFASYVTSGFFQDFFATSARPLVVEQALGLASVVPGIFHVLSRITQYLVVGGLLLGFIAVVVKRRLSVAEEKMLPLMSVAAVLIGLSTVLPFFAAGLNFSRVFQIALIFFAPCLVYWYEAVQRTVSFILRHVKLNRIASIQTRSLFLVILLMSYFIFVSGWVWAVTLASPTSFAFDSQRMAGSTNGVLLTDYYSEFTVQPDVEAAVWARSYVTNPICGDYISGAHVLTSYGEQSPASLTMPSDCDYSNSSLYLSQLNSIYGIGTIYGGTWSVADIAPLLMSQNRIYSNGATIIYSPVIIG